MRERETRAPQRGRGFENSRILYEEIVGVALKIFMLFFFWSIEIQLTY